jgi:hypothetical protein
LIKLTSEFVLSAPTSSPAKFTHKHSPHSPFHALSQACTTYGPRAKCGPRKLLIWPSKPQILFSLLVSLIKTPFEWIKTYQLWPLDMSKGIFDIRFELCTPARSQVSQTQSILRTSKATKTAGGITNVPTNQRATFSKI